MNQLPTNGDLLKNLPKKIALIYSDVKREYFPTEAQYITEKSASEDATVIASYLNKIGIETALVPGNAELAVTLHQIKPDMAINLVGSVKGNEYLASAIPGVLELLEIPYTGTGILGEAMGYNKFIVKKLLEQHGVPVPHYQLVNTPNDLLDPTLRYPLISKLNEIHGAVEITQDAVSDTEKHLCDRLRYLIQTYQQPVLVEEFIVGREITSFLLEGLKKKVYCGEKIFHPAEDRKYVFTDFESQWTNTGTPITYQKYSDSILAAYVRKAFRVLKMADYAKFDTRLDSSGRYYFIDANSNPFFGPKELDSAMANILDMYGISFDETIKRLLLNTVKDYS